NSAAIAMPPRIDARMPTIGMPVRWPATKPTTAPTAIIPSTPRLSTPDRSETSSPSAAKRSGVAATTIVSSIPCSSSIPMARLHGKARRRPGDPHPVEDQRVAGEDEEQQQPLEDAGDLLRDGVGNLHALTAEIGQRQDEAGDDDAERIEPAEEGNDDRGEAVAGRNGDAQLAERPGDLADAGEPGKPARHQKHQQNHAVLAEAGEGGGARRLAEDADPE